MESSEESVAHLIVHAIASSERQSENSDHPRKRKFNERAEQRNPTSAEVRAEDLLEVSRPAQIESVSFRSRGEDRRTKRF